MLPRLDRSRRNARRRPGDDSGGRRFQRDDHRGGCLSDQDRTLPGRQTFLTRVLGDRTRLRYFSYIKSPRNGAVAIFNGGAGALRALDAARSDFAFVSRRSRNEFFLPATRAHFALAPA